MKQHDANNNPSRTNRYDYILTGKEGNGDLLNPLTIPLHTKRTSLYVMIARIRGQLTTS